MINTERIDEQNSIIDGFSLNDEQPNKSVTDGDELIELTHDQTRSIVGGIYAPPSTRGCYYGKSIGGKPTAPLPCRP